jgi:hypothetical protein
MAVSALGDRNRASKMIFCTVVPMLCLYRPQNKLSVKPTVASSHWHSFGQRRKEEQPPMEVRQRKLAVAVGTA